MASSSILTKFELIILLLKQHIVHVGRPYSASSVAIIIEEEIFEQIKCYIHITQAFEVIAKKKRYF